MTSHDEIRRHLARADAYLASGEDQAATAFYGAALRLAASLGGLPPDLMAACRLAQTRVAELVARYERFLTDRLSSEGLTPEADARFERALDLLLNKRRPFEQAPKTFLFPGLPVRETYDADRFTWAAALEAETAAIREEAYALMSDEAAFTPYVTATDERPQDAHRLVDAKDWSAYYLWRDGEPSAQAAATCPRTVAAMERVPLARVPGRSPNVLFSRLRAGAHIPPHTGLINTRLICHLPLIVPSGCTFRVGHTVTGWTEGRTLIFDDTIEHEAQNEGASDRIVLLFEVWQPDLDERERSQVATLLSAVDAYGKGG